MTINKDNSQKNWSVTLIDELSKNYRQLKIWKWY